MRSLILSMMLLSTGPLAAQDMRPVTACLDKSKLLAAAMLFVDGTANELDEFFANNSDVCFRTIELPFPVNAQELAQPFFKHVLVLTITTDKTFYVPVYRQEVAYASNE